MKNNKVWLTGPTMGRDAGLSEFRKYANKLEKLGYEVAIPHDLFLEVSVLKHNRDKVARACIHHMLECDMVVTLDHATLCEHANMEIDIARMMKMNKVHVHSLIQIAEEKGWKPLTWRQRVVQWFDGKFGWFFQNGNKVEIGPSGDVCPSDEIGRVPRMKNPPPPPEKKLGYSEEDRCFRFADKEIHFRAGQQLTADQAKTMDEIASMSKEERFKKWGTIDLPAIAKQIKELDEWVETAKTPTKTISAKYADALRRLSVEWDKAGRKK